MPYMSYFCRRWRDVICLVLLSQMAKYSSLLFMFPLVLSSNQPLTEMCTRSISWGQRLPVRKADNLPPITKSGNVNFLKASGPLRACNGTALPLPCTCLVKRREVFFNCLLVFSTYLTENTFSIIETNGVNIRRSFCALSVIFVGF